MGQYSSREPFGLAMNVLGSTIIPTTVKKLAIIALKQIMTPSFVTLDMFALSVPILFTV